MTNDRFMGAYRHYPYIRRYHYTSYGPYYGKVKRADGEILADIRQSLVWDSYLDADRIHVQVDGGVVTLTGTVDSAIEKRLAGDEAWDTLGVVDVHNDLELKRAEVTEAERVPADQDRELVRDGGGTRRDDLDVKADVAEALDMDPDISSDRITVEVDSGTVILRGTVNSLSESRSAEADAANVPGVTDVRNELSVGKWKGVRSGPGEPPFGR